MKLEEDKNPCRYRGLHGIPTSESATIIGKTVLASLQFLKLRIFSVVQQRSKKMTCRAGRAVPGRGRRSLPADGNVLQPLPAHEPLHGAVRDSALLPLKLMPDLARSEAAPAPVARAWSFRGPSRPAGAVRGRRRIADAGVALRLDALPAKRGVRLDDSGWVLPLTFAPPALLPVHSISFLLSGRLGQFISQAF